MPPTPTNISACPPWCSGHDDDQEPAPPRWHRGVPTVLTLMERPNAFLLRGAASALTTTEFVVAPEQDERSAYVYMGAFEDAGRFFAFTRDSARLLHAALGDALECME